MDKILVNIDFKHDPSVAIAKAIHLAELNGAEIELFSSCYNRSIKHGYVFDQEEEQRAEHGYTRQIENKLEVLCQSIREKGIHASSDVCWNPNPVEGVVRKVLRFAPDLLIHPIKQHSRIGHYLFAPTDWQIARKCPVPVLFVKDRPWQAITRITACIDPLHVGDEQGMLDREILQRCQLFTTGGHSELRVLHCYNTLPHEAIFDEHVVTDYEALQVKVEKTHFERCNKLLCEFELSTDSSHVDILKGETDLTISNYAKHNAIDVVVMGAVARSVFDRLLVGSTMEYVVDHVDCDVLIVKRPDFVSPITE